MPAEAAANRPRVSPCQFYDDCEAVAARRSPAPALVMCASLGERDIGRDGDVHHEPLGAPFARDITNAGGARLRRRAQDDLAGVGAQRGVESQCAATRGVHQEQLDLTDPNQGEILSSRRLKRRLGFDRRRR